MIDITHVFRLVLTYRAIGELNEPDGPLVIPEEITALEPANQVTVATVRNN